MSVKLVCNSLLWRIYMYVIQIKLHSPKKKKSTYGEHFLRFQGKNSRSSVLRFFFVFKIWMPIIRKIFSMKITSIDRIILYQFLNNCINLKYKIQSIMIKIKKRYKFLLIQFDYLIKYSQLDKIIFELIYTIKNHLNTKLDIF